MSLSRPFRVVLFSGQPPDVLTQLLERIEADVPGAKVCGILYEPRPTKTLRERGREFVRNLGGSDFRAYAAARIVRGVFSCLARAGSQGLRFLHGCPPPGPPRTRTTSLEALVAFCEKRGCSVRITRDLHSPDTLAFVKGLEPDLGLVYGTRILKPSLFEIPRLGSINVHKRKVPDYRGSGPIGLWELLDGQTEIGVTVHRVAAKVDTGPIIHEMTIPVGPYDTLTSLALKADVVGHDLLVRSVRDLATGTSVEKPQAGGGRTFRMPPPQQLRRYVKQVAAQRPAYSPPRGRPWWKLLLRTLALMPLGALRNWYRRVRGSFPVVVLYHHLVTDRPHPMGIPTDLFFRHVRFLQRYYRVVSLEEAVRMLQSGKVTAPTVVLTLDDGYQENYLNLRAVTEVTGAPVTLFVSSEHVRTQQEFAHDEKWGLQAFRPLTWEQVKELDRSGWCIGSHTRWHFDCGSTDLALLRSEIQGSKADLEGQLGHEVLFFSFPWGLPANMSPEAVALAKETYSSVCSANGGVNDVANKDGYRHIRRCPHSNDLWELELTLQSMLD